MYWVGMGGGGLVKGGGWVGRCLCVCVGGGGGGGAGWDATCQYLVTKCFVFL